MTAFLVILYFLILIAVCLRIIINTSTPSKGLAYLLLVISFPFIGIIFYLSVGLNYRKRKLYKKKIDIDEKAYPELEIKKANFTEQILNKHRAALGSYFPLANLNKLKASLSDNNRVKLLINGEEKFPAILESLQKARHHIHIEYYIYENDSIGNQIADILIAKAKEGLEVRFIYDDFGSKGIRKNLVKRLRAAGVEAYPFYKINIIQLANRINYRNHRKIIVIDGKVGFVGGINVSDKYINTEKNKLYWRDTHLKIEGMAVLNLQFTFLTDWNFCSRQAVSFNTAYFPYEEANDKIGNQLVQIISSGPDSDYPGIMYSLIQTMLLAKKELLITTPYFIPAASFVDAIKIAAQSGVKVKLLVPGISDSFVVNITSQSFYEELMQAGVEIFKYQKGFVHAKTLVCDRKILTVGTANLDNRSFDLNFEINAVVFDPELAEALANQIETDMSHASQINIDEWNKRPRYIKLLEKIFKLFSSLM